MMNEEVLKKIHEAKANGATELYLGGMGITTLPPEIFQLLNLTVLDLRHNQFSSLPPEICQLPNLTELNLWNNRLSEQCAAICQLPNLMVLDLRNNQFSSLPPEICKLTKLKELNLYGNYISRLPSEIGRLTELTWLNLGHNHFNTLPPEIGKLTNLTKLDLRHSEFTSLPPEICKLTKLKELNLSNNEFNTLPLEICQLTKLQLLFLLDNQLTTLPPEICQLRKLMLLNLSNNHLSSLPPEICKLRKLEELYFGRNPLIDPPYEIAIKGIDAIYQYFSALKPEISIGVGSNPVLLQSEDQPLNEAKVILVGDGAAGKTSLVKRLLDLSFDHQEDTTHGINIKGWQQDLGDRKIRINIWDFGGQVIQHTTHQFFLSKRSLYILVLDGRKEERPEYWLQHIESFGGDSPVLVVLNKQDESCSFNLNTVHLQRKYPAVKGFYPTSCKKNTGLEEFRSALLRELPQVLLLNTPWPKSWFQVKQNIEQSGKPYISCEEYEGICKKAGIAEKKNQKTLVNYLHDLGAAVHFDDYVLNAMHVLDPVWVTQAVYKIITAKEMADSNGLLRLARLTEILRHEEREKHSWPVQTHVYILELMKKFQLCWGIGEEAVLLPQLLPVDEPEFVFDYSGSLGFVLQYQDFLPPSVFPRFMVKVHQSIKPGLCWRTGVVLEYKDSGTEAVIKSDLEARRIQIWVYGPNRKEYLSFLWGTLRLINDSFEKLNISERIPMPDDPTCSADYQTLLDCVEDRIERCRPDGAKRAYTVKELLGLVEPTREDQVVELLQMIRGQLDEKNSATKTAVNLFELKPNLFGVGFNLNEVFALIRDRKKQK
ncbi:leucine-rich repeat domain-containing protein [Desulfobulbus sp. TB]|nr:leucine-rich repeat domain-containing protein [Desulfobulbus sp. TB]